MTPRMDSAANTTDHDSSAGRRLEASLVVLCLVMISGLFHAPSLFLPSQFLFSPSDITGRQPEFGGSAVFEPANRLLIDPILQFQPWDFFARQQLANGQFPWWNPYSGAGAPFAGNGQSQLFDPVKILFRCLPSPWAWAAESAFRFVLTGLGLYGLCRHSQAGPWARTWAALALPMTGFFTLWRLYPLVAVGSVMPWFLLAFERLQARPSPPRCRLAALATAWLMVSGNVQLAAAGCMAVGLRSLLSHPTALILNKITWMGLSLAIGFLISAPAWVSLADYIHQSPVWADRIAEHSGEGRGASARWPDLPTLIAPYVYGSERRGDPNLHKAIGAGNVNEAASGYVGMISLLALIPAAFLNPKIRLSPLFRYGALLWLAGLLIGYRLPPVAWLWPHLPILQGIDPRRFLVGMSLGGTILAGLGLQSLAEGFRSPFFDRLALRIWLALAISFSLAATAPWLFKTRLQGQATRHYQASVEPGPDHESLVKTRVASQIQSITKAWPAYMVSRSLLILALGAAFLAFPNPPRRRCIAIGLLSLLELFHFGWYVNPHVRRSWLADVPDPALVRRLHEISVSALGEGLEARFLAVGEALPPNQLMHFGLKDLRNYDSIELTRNLARLDTLYEPKPDQERTSRRSIRWSGVQATQALLQTMGVVGVVGLTEPPEGVFDSVETPLKGVWLGLWKPLGRCSSSHARWIIDKPGHLRLRIDPADKIGAGAVSTVIEPVIIREMYDPGWRISTEAANSGVRLGEDPATGFLSLLVPVVNQPLEVDLKFQPLHWKESCRAMMLGILVFCTVPAVCRIGQIKIGKYTVPIVRDQG